MTLTDEEAKAIILELRADAACTWCDGVGKEANLDGDGHTNETCRHCEGSGVEFPTTRAIIAILESRIGQPDLSARVRELEEAKDRAFETCARIIEKDHLDDTYDDLDSADWILKDARRRMAAKVRAARALKGES